MNNNEIDPFAWNDTLLKYVTIVTFSAVFFPMIAFLIVIYRAIILASL